MVHTNKKIKQILKQFEKKENYKLYLSYKSFEKTVRNKLMLGWGLGFELTTCDFWFKSQIQSFHFFSHNFSFPVYTEPFHPVKDGGVNKKQIPLKSYSLEIRIDSVNQILKNKERVK